MARQTDDMQQSIIDSITSMVSKILDPEMPMLTIADLGILRAVKQEGADYYVEITPTYTACPATIMIMQMVQETLAQGGFDNAHVRRVMSPAWSTDWISPTGLDKLRRAGIAPPQPQRNDDFFSQLPVMCPACDSSNTECISAFGSTACKSLHRCKVCAEPFEHFKCH